MSMTEQEARTKDCPLGALKIIGAYAAGEVAADWPKWCRCVASDCAMWRKAGIMDSETRQETDHGYCGLVGRSE